MEGVSYYRMVLLGSRLFSMNSKKLLIVVLTVLLGICFCGLCISTFLFVASPAFFRARESTIAASQTTALPETMPYSWITPSMPSSTYALSPTDELSSTGEPTPILTVPFVDAPTKDETIPSIPTETQILEPALTYASSPTSGSVAFDSWCVPWNTDTSKARVQEVIDGITIEVMIDGNVFPVRYVGIEMPDYSGDPTVWSIAREKNRALVEGLTVLLVKDRSEVDSEGRLLRYVLAGPVFVNRQLVESGYAIAVDSPPDISCNGIFREAESLARATGRGLWAPTPTPSRTIPTHTPTPAPTGDVIIVKIFSKGTIWQEPEEYVEIYNDGSQPVQLQDWTLRDTKSHVFVFPGFILGPQQYCRVYTDLYLPKHCGFTYYSLSPIWDNNGDCAYLKDGDGVLIDMLCYE